MTKVYMSKQQVSDFDRMVDRELSQVMGAQKTQVDQLARAAQLLELRKAKLMPSQLKFLQDPSKKKAAICTRRAGKTFVVRHMAAEAVLKNSWTDRNRAQPVIQYIAKTQKRALDLFWTPFKEICREIGLDAHWDDHNLRAQFPNGVLVRAAGANDKEGVDKVLGDAYVLVVIDESASFGPLIEDLVLQGIEPALMDYGGTIAMVGTPGQAQAGLFWEIYSGTAPKWSKHDWSYMTNIHLAAEVRTEKWIEENVGPLDSPRIRREYFGEWVPDANSLVYQFREDKCEWDGVLPEGHDWQYILGMDLGYRDPAAFVVGAYARTHPCLYIVSAEAHPHLLPSQIEKRVLELRSEFGLNRIVCDIGGSMALSNVMEWNRRNNLGMMPAQKNNKYTFVEHMNSEFHLGRIKVHPKLTELKKEWKCLVWDEPDVQTSVRHDNKPKEHPGFPNHMSDAALYMFRESSHFRSKSPEPEPVRGTLEYLNKQQLDAKLKAIREAGSGGFKYGKLWKSER